jgi:hypothetical protein
MIHPTAAELAMWTAGRTGPSSDPRPLLRTTTPEEWARFEGNALGRILDEEDPTEPELDFDLENEPSTPTLLVLADPPPPWAVAALLHQALGLGPYDKTPPECLLREPFETTVIDEQLLEDLLQKGLSR